MPIAQLMALIGVDGNPAQVAMDKLKSAMVGLGNVIKNTFSFAGASVKALLSPLQLARTGIEKFMKLLFTLTGPIFIFKIISNDLQELASYMSAAEVNAWRLKTAFGETAGAVSQWAVEMQKATGISSRVFEDGILRLRSLQANYGLATEQIKNLGVAATDLGQIMNVQAYEAFTRMESAIRGEAEAAERLGLNLQDNYMRHQAFGGVLDEVWLELTESEKAQFRYIEALKQAQFATGAAQEALAKGVSGYRVFYSAVQDAANILWNTLKPAVGSVGLVFAGMGKYLVEWTQTLSAAFSSGGIKGVFEALPSKFQSIVKIIEGLFGPVVKNILKVVSVVGSYMGDIVTTIENVINTLTPAWTDFWNFLGQVVTEFVDEVLPYLLAFLNETAAAFAEAWPVIYTLVKAAWTGIKSIIVPTLQYLWPAISQTLAFIRDLFATINAFIAGDTEEGWDRIRVAFLAGAKAIVQLIKPAIEFVARAFAGLAGVVNKSLTYIVGALNGFQGETYEAMKSWSDDSLGTMLSGIDQMSDAVDQWLQPAKIEKRTKEASEAAGDGLIDGFKSWWDKMKAAGEHTMMNYADGIKSFNADEAFKAMMSQVEDRFKSTDKAAKGAAKALSDYFNEMTEALQMQVFRAETLWDIWKAQFKGAEESPEYLAHKLQSLNDKMAALQGSLPAFNTLWEEAKNTLGANSDEAERLEREILNLKKSMAETSREIETLTDDLLKMTKKDTIKQIDDLSDAIVKALRNMYEKRKKEELDAVDNSIKAEKKRHKDYMDNLDAEYDKNKRNVNADAKKGTDGKDTEIDGIDRQMELLRRAQQDKEELTDIEALKEELKYEQMWGDAKKAAVLQKKLDEAEAKRRLRLQLDELADQRDKLKQEKEAIEDQAADELQRLEDEYDNKKKIEDQAYEETIERLENEKQATEDHYAELLDSANLHAEAIKLIEDKNMQEILDLLHKYGDNWDTLGKTYGERLVEGLHESDPLIDGWVQDTFSKISKILSTEGFNKIVIDKLNNYIKDLQSQWLATTDPAKKDALHATADAVREIIGGLGGTAIPAYDKGGPIWENQFAAIHGGEYMLNRSDVQNIGSWLSTLDSGEFTPGNGIAQYDKLINIEHMEIRDDSDIERVSADLKKHIDSRSRFDG